MHLQDCCQWSATGTETRIATWPCHELTVAQAGGLRVAVEVGAVRSGSEWR